MRKRSMSVYATKDEVKLLKKFEGVASDNEAHLESEDETKEDAVISGLWTKADYESLAAQVKDTLPKKDHRKWKTSLQAVNWEQIKIPGRTTQEVEQVAKQLIAKVRSFRTLSEILNDVPEVVTKLLTAERPKPPLTAYSLFVKEMLPQLREEHKDLKVQQIFKIVPQLFQELSAKKRRRYEHEAARMKEEYHANLAKFYEEHPDVKPSKIRKEPLKTPFQLFYQSRRGQSENIPCQQVRKEWESLPLKEKVPFIRQSFEAQADTDSKLLNKKELQMLDQDLGKPEYMGHNAYEFFRRKIRSRYDSIANGNEREQHIRMDYKKLDARELWQLKEEFQAARASFVHRYQQYIKKLPKDKRQAEIDYLKTISDKAIKKPKTETKSPLNTAVKHEFAGSADEDPPVAESTTIHKKSAKKVKGKSKFEESAEESESSFNRSSRKKQPKLSVATPPPPPPSTSKLLGISKSEPHASSDSSSDDYEDEDFEPTKHRKNVPATPSRNGSDRKVSATKKRSSPPEEDVKPVVEVKKSKKSSSKAVKAASEEDEEEEDVKPAVEVKKSKKSSSKAVKATSEEDEEEEDIKPKVEGKKSKKPSSKAVKAASEEDEEEEDIKPKVEGKKSKKPSSKAVKAASEEEEEDEEEEPETPPPPKSSKATKAAKTKETEPEKLTEPEKPPKDIEEFYRQRFYKGKPGKHAEAFGNLTAAKKREISEQLKAAQKQYIVDFEHFLKSMPRDEIRKYIQKVNAKKKAESTDDDSDDGDDDDAEAGSSSEEEEEDDDE